MSLLLQALKKAEEDKRRRAASAGSESASVEFPTLNLVEDVIAAAESSTLAEDIGVEASASEWDFTSPEVELPVQESELIVVEPLDLLIQPIPETRVESSRPLEADLKPAETLSAAAMSPAIPSSPIDPEPISPKVAQAVAKSLFTKSPRPQGRGLLPWLVLGAGLLLAGMLAWFTWQYRQLTQTSPSVAVIAPASAPATHNAGYVDENSTIEQPQADTHVNEPATPVIETPSIKVDDKPKPAATKPISRSINDSSELNPPLKFIRQAPNLSAPEPVLLAWQAYQNGDFAQAERIYRKVLLTDPRQRDAILGLAAIAQQRGDMADAEALYRRLLRFNPQDEAAKAALLGLNSAQMPEKEAVQLEQSGKSDPMVLGHYFAAQQRWSQAQEQFFLAYNANPNSADAALNLAVSLDHLQQTSLALTYYRKALQAKEQINFDRNTIELRIGQLEAVAGREP